MIYKMIKKMNLRKAKGTLINWKSIALIIATSLLLGSCKGDEAPQQHSSTSSPIEVTTKKPVFSEQGHFPASGRTRAAQTTRLSTRAMGSITGVYVEVGDRVRKGQRLVSISSKDLEAQRSGAESVIQEAQTALEAVKRDYNRIEILYESQSATRKEFDDISAQLDMAKARLRTAESAREEINAQFLYVDMRAPFSGIITEKLVEPGEIAAPGQPLLTLENQESFEVWAMVPESDITKISKEKEVRIVLSSSPDPLKGTIKSISPTSEGQSGQFQVKISLNAPSTNIMAGMYARVLFPQESAAETIMVPTSALIQQGDLRGVYTVSEDGHAILRWLRLGRTQNDFVEVLAGLNADEEIIAAYEGKIYNGAKVTRAH
ncbi:MAG: efflux RND transporter periplasmic adaptor subunit [Saprospirales bacterium]|nr:MAG: efflux RND transporter periplasmic adaptor subunit [Saprospirales bacterium]